MKSIRPPSPKTKNLDCPAVAVAKACGANNLPKLLSKDVLVSADNGTKLMIALYDAPIKEI